MMLALGRPGGWRSHQSLPAGRGVRPQKRARARFPLAAGGSAAGVRRRRERIAAQEIPGGLSGHPLQGGYAVRSFSTREDSFIPEMESPRLSRPAFMQASFFDAAAPARSSPASNAARWRRCADSAYLASATIPAISICLIAPCSVAGSTPLPRTATLKRSARMMLISPLFARRS